MVTKRFRFISSLRRALSARPGAAMPALLAVFLAFPLGAREAVTWETKSFADMSLEDLLNESVTSVSKREQKLGDAAASVSVLSHDDLRRSGFTTIADALRLVPGMNVASVNSHQWAISARGFNNQYANKLLVLMDGRAVYTPLFAGVYWDMHQTMLEDIQRIEVVRGPGATVWGANAVNGVINVLTRSARDTQGGLLFASGGDIDEVGAGFRYGGKLGENTFYRLSTSYRQHDDFPAGQLVSPFPGFPLPPAPASGTADDHWNGLQASLRLDHYPDHATQLTWQNDFSQSEFDAGHSHGYNLSSLGRWTRQLSDRSTVEAQAYIDRLHREESLRAGHSQNTADLTLQQTLGLGASHDVIWGVGYRFQEVLMKQTSAALPIANDHFKLQLLSAFAQDEIKLIPDRLAVTVGVKVEHNDFTGWEYQPSVRAVFKPTPRQTIWAAWSRAVRTPSLLEGKDVFGAGDMPPIPWMDGNFYFFRPSGAFNPRSEVLFAHELGWRFQPHSRVSVDLSAFANRYERTIGAAPEPVLIPGVPFGTALFPYVNLPDPTTSYGGEATVTATLNEFWRVTAGYSLLQVSVPGWIGEQNLDPKHQATLRLSRDFRNGASLDVQLRHASDTLGVPDYLTADVRLAYRLSQHAEISIAGQNLLDSRHPEQSFAIFANLAEVPRRVHAKITWQF